MSAAPHQEVHVLAGVIFDEQNRVLLAQRPQGKDLAGLWEFPGGKIEPGETRFEALTRELSEELGIKIGPARPLTRVRHAYPHKTVLLDFWIVREFQGIPRELDGQALAWRPADELSSVPLLPADVPMLRLLVLPDTLTRTSGPGYSIVDSMHARPADGLVGVLCGASAEVRQAVADDADFIVMRTPLPPAETRALCSEVPTPVYVVGMSPPQAWSLGATGIAAADLR